MKTTVAKIDSAELESPNGQARYLTLVDELYEEATAGFFAPMAGDLVDMLIGQHDADKKRITELAAHMSSSEVHASLHLFIQGNLSEERHGIPRTIKNLFNLEGAIGQLTADYWAKAFSLTDVYDYMPQARRDEWNNQIRYPLGKRKESGSPEILPLPLFEENSVRSTLQSLLNSRPQFFSERVDGIFKGLSGFHVTNQPEGFSKRMIINRAISNGHVCSSTAGLVNDLRCIIAKFMGRDEPKWGSTHQVFDIVRCDNGVWRDVDAGALRIRIYNGVGTVHLEVHPEMAWRLNAVLASMYPSAIPHKYRKKPTRVMKEKSFKLFDKPLPFAVLDCLAGMKQGFEVVKSDFRTSRKPIPRSLGGLSLHSTDKAIKKQTEEVLRAIGGVFNGIDWVFAYEPESIIQEIICSGLIPDIQSHQFYPTPECLAEEVIHRASKDAGPDMIWCEPQAGTGGIADSIPKNVNLTCCEVSELHCQILKAKGYSSSVEADRHVEHVDFLVYAKEYTGKGFDRIVMNPPFSEGRWTSHLKAAAGILSDEGRLVAILPASARHKELIPGFSHNYSSVYENRFAGTSISVVILTLEKTV